MFASLLALGVFSVATLPRTEIPLHLRPDIPPSQVPIAPGIVLGPEPSLVGVSQGSPSPLADTLVGQAAPRPHRYSIHLTGLLPNADQVVVYLEDERVADGLAQAADWTLHCSLPATPRRSGLLRVWVFRAGEGPIPLPPVALEPFRAPTPLTDRLPLFP